MTEDEFTKLFQYMQKMEAKLDGVIENMATKKDIQEILAKFDSIEK